MGFMPWWFTISYPLLLLNLNQKSMWSQRVYVRQCCCQNWLSWSACTKVATMYTDFPTDPARCLGREMWGRVVILPQDDLRILYPCCGFIPNLKSIRCARFYVSSIASNWQWGSVPTCLSTSGCLFQANTMWDTSASPPWFSTWCSVSTADFSLALSGECLFPIRLCWNLSVFQYEEWRFILKNQNS